MIWTVASEVMLNCNTQPEKVYCTCNTHTHTHTHIRARMHARTHTHTFTHIHTQSLWKMHLRLFTASLSGLKMCFGRIHQTLWSHLILWEKILSLKTTLLRPLLEIQACFSMDNRYANSMISMKSHLRWMWVL